VEECRVDAEIKMNGSQDSFTFSARTIRIELTMKRRKQRTARTKNGPVSLSNFRLVFAEVR
jgi:hypothetical protein